MKKNWLFLLLVSYCLLFLAPGIHAAYVLPYPSFMPGNKIYKVLRIVDRAKAYWYWGELGQAKYHMALADKYLVEAKVLFEYQQYLLAVDALKRSDEHIKQAATIEQKAEHVRVLERIKQEVPVEFTWTPEKAEATQLPLHELLDVSIALRK